ncbi:tRNA (adenine(22)-N(1))-methyltransferase [Eubacteriales bacterium KG127]
MLSERLYTLAAGINQGETMADIGTDHGFLPAYLIENQISPWAIAIDVSANSLKKAEKFNCKNLYCRLGDGIKVLKDGEVDVIVIAGMGGILISEILGDDLDKSRSFNRFILQPRSKVGYLRRWLNDNGFTISHEDIVCEVDKLWEILTVVPTQKCHYDYPFDLVNYPNKYTERYLNFHIKKNQYILDNISNNLSNTCKIQSIRETVGHLENLKKLLKGESV